MSGVEGGFGSPAESNSKGKGKNTNRAKSQRPSWSCTECSRRKIRCDKVIPCRPCTVRGAADACHLSLGTSDSKYPLVQSGSHNPATIPLATSDEMINIRKSLSDLRQQLWHLEGVVSNFVPQGQSADGTALFAYNGKMIKQAEDEIDELEQTDFSALDRGQGSSSRINLPLERVREDTQQLPDSDGEVEAATTLEFLALGRDRKQDHLNRSELRRPDSPYSNSVDQQYPPAALAVPSVLPYPPPLPPHDILPPRELSAAIVRYSLENFGWQHGAVHMPSFEAESVEFYSWGERRFSMVNQSWLALFYAILCVGVKHMSAETAAECSISTDDLKNLPKRYFDASVESLHRANFLAKHSIFSVQTIAILVMTCQDVGGSDLIATLLATGIRIAQHLNLHRFTSDADWQARRLQNGVDPMSETGVKALIDREVRKRLWCALTTEDWLSIAYRRSYCIFPSHCTTPLPANCHDSDLATGQLVNRPLDEPTTVNKLLLSMRIASCVRVFFEGMNVGGLSYELCLQVDKEIRDTIRAAPHSLQANSEISHLPPYIRFMAHYFIMSSSHKLLIVHRTFLGRKNTKYDYSKTAAISAAKSILYEFPKGATLPFQDLWTSIYHSVAASTTLVMDMFQNPATPTDEINHLVEASLQELARLQDTSPIAARGVQLLSTLLAEAETHRQNSADKLANKRKRGDNSEDDNFGNVAKRVSNSVQTSPPSSSSNSLSPSTHLPLPFLPYYPSIPSGGFSYNNAVEFGVSQGDSDLEFWRLLEGFDTPIENRGENIIESGTWSS